MEVINLLKSLLDRIGYPLAIHIRNFNKIVNN